MTLIPFSGAVPRRYLWVDDNAPKGGDGSKDHPFNSIQTAIAKAQPGTAVMVMAGEYRGNIVIPRDKDGTADAPIWLVSADGPGAAHLIATSQGRAVIEGGGVQNFIVDGFWTTGGKNGIHFGQNGTDYTDTIANIVIRNNFIENPREDGVKANAGHGVYVLNNKTVGGKDEGIDFVSIVGGMISGNEVSGNTGTSAGIFAKAGSADVLISNNYVHDNAAIGISVGGYADPNYSMMAGYDTFQAKNVVVRDNVIVDNGRTALSVFGGTDVLITNNYMDVNQKHFTGVWVGSSNPTKYGTFTSSEVTITGNWIDDHRRILTVENGSSATFSGNGEQVQLATRSSGFLHDMFGTAEQTAPPSPSVPISSPVPPSPPTPVSPPAKPSPAQPLPAVDDFRLIQLEQLFTGDNTNNNLAGGDRADGIRGGGGNDLLRGGGGNDVISGDDGNDTISGGAGNDIMRGGAGNDEINGAHGFDRAAYAGNLSDYTIIVDSSGRLHISGGTDGHDIVMNIEEFSFGSTTYTYLEVTGMPFTGV